MLAFQAAHANDGIFIGEDAKINRLSFDAFGRDEEQLLVAPLSQRPLEFSSLRCNYGISSAAGASSLSVKLLLSRIRGMPPSRPCR